MAPAPSRKAWTQKDGKLPVNVVRRAQGQGPSDRRDRRVDACADRYAARPASAGGHAGRRMPSLGGIFNMGGAAVANYVSVLERVK
jgi:acetyl-CoA C-acetyltransferase